MRILIVGGVAAGAGAATKARRVNEDAEIVLFEKGGYVSFANCGLPYYIGKVIEDREELLLFTPELFKSRFNVDVRLNTTVTEYDLGGYDEIVLATKFFNPMGEDRNMRGGSRRWIVRAVEDGVGLAGCHGGL